MEQNQLGNELLTVQQKASELNKWLHEESKNSKGKFDKNISEDRVSELCTGYDTFLRFQKFNIELCEFIVSMIHSPSTFKKKFPQHNKILHELNLIEVNGEPLIGSILGFLELFKDITSDSIPKNIHPIDILEESVHEFKKIINTEKSPNDCELKNLEERYLVLGYLRYIINIRKKLSANDLTQSSESDPTRNVNSVVKYLSETGFDTKAQRTKKIEYFEVLINRIVCLDQFDGFTDANKMGLFQRLKEKNINEFKVFNYLRQVLRYEYLLENDCGISSEVDDMSIWHWFLKNKLIFAMVGSEEKNFLDLKNIVKISTSGFKLTDLHKKLNLPLKNHELSNSAAQSYFEQLCETARKSSNFPAFLDLVLEEVRGTLIIKSSNERNSLLAKTLKLFKSEQIEKLLKMNEGSNQSKTALTVISQRLLNEYSEPKIRKSDFQKLYLKYTDQLWGEGKSRYEGKVLPRQNDLFILVNSVKKYIPNESELVNNLISYLDTSRTWGTCINNLYLYSEQNVSLNNTAEVISGLCNHFEISFDTLQEIIDKEIRAHNQLENAEISDSEILSKAEINQPLSNLTKIECFNLNCLVRLIINVCFNKETEIKELIKLSISEELECAHRAVFYLEFIEKYITKTDRIKFQQKYLKQKNLHIQIAKMYSAFVLIKSGLDYSHQNIEHYIGELALSYLKLSTKPTSFEGFISEPQKILKVDDPLYDEISTFPFEKLIEIKADGESDNKFFYNEYLIGELSKLNLNLSATEVAFSYKGVVESVWNTLINVSDSLLFTSLISSFLDNASLQKENRYEYKSYLTTGAYFKSYLTSLTNKGFEELIFPTNIGDVELLQNKITALGELVDFGDTRFVIKTGIGLKPKKLGSGSFGCVFLAEDTLFNTEVAIKLIPTWGKSKKIETKLISEASVMRKCQHENVVLVYDLHKFTTESFKPLNIKEVINEKYVYGIILDYIDEARTLKEFSTTKEFKNYTYKQKLDLFINICKGVEQAHNLIPQVVHGDIKPENILIDKGGVPKLTDFGVASTAGSYLTGSSGKAYATSNVLNGEKATHQDDIHSLGMLLIYILYPKISRVIEDNLHDLWIKEKLVALMYTICEFEWRSNLSEGLSPNGDGFLDLSVFLDSKLSKELYIFTDSLSEYFNTPYDRPYEVYWPFSYILKALIESEEQGRLILNRPWCPKYVIEPVRGTRDKCYLSYEEYDNVNSFAFDIGVLKTGSVKGSPVKIQKKAFFGGQPITQSSISRFPEKNIHTEFERSGYDHNKLTVLCRFDGYKKDHMSFLAKFPDNNTFLFHQPYSIMTNSYTNLLKYFYEPNELLIDDVIHLNEFGFSNSVFMALVNNLDISTQRKQRVEENELTQILDTFDQDYAHLSSALKTFTKQFHQLICEICNDSPVMKAIVEMNDLEHLELFDINSLYEVYRKAKNKEEMLVMLEKPDFYGIDAEIISNWLFHGEGYENLLMKRFLKKQRGLNDWELIRLFFETTVPYEFVFKIQAMIDSLINSEAFKLLKQDLENIKDFMTKNVTEHHYWLMCYQKIHYSGLHLFLGPRAKVPMVPLVEIG